jgi:RNA polymerase sigma-70 factor, ECF subfamily
MNAMTSEQVEQLTAQWTAAQQTISVFVQALVPDFHESEEILQQVAVALVRKYDQYDPSQPFLHWAIGFAKVEASRYLRRRGSERLVFCDDASLDRLAETCLRMESNIAEFDKVLDECIEQLDGRSHRAIRLRYVESMKSAHIAAEMKMSQGAVKVLLHRARTLLRTCIEAHGLAPTAEI